MALPKILIAVLGLQAKAMFCCRNTALLKNHDLFPAVACILFEAVFPNTPLQTALSQTLQIPNLKKNNSTPKQIKALTR